MRTKRWLACWVWVAPLAILAGGCGKEQTKVYYVPKEGETAKPASMANAAPAEQPQIQWKTPTGWQEQPGEGGTINFTAGPAASQAQFSIKTFPSMGMSQLDMVNISRESAGLPALDEAGFSKLAEPVAIGSEKGTLLDFKGPMAEILLTVLDHDGVTWFFKMMGATDAVSAQKAAMIDFLKSVSFAPGGRTLAQGMHFGANSGQAPSSSPMTPPPGMMVAGGPAAPAATSSAKPSWTLPSNWKEIEPGDMILARFSITGEGQGEVTVSSFPGDVGGLFANVNRWRGQMKLSPIAESDLSKSVTTVDVIGGQASLVDITGQDAKTGKDARLLGLIWPHGGQTWFFKLTADPAVAAREKDAFLKFAQTIRFPNA